MLPHFFPRERRKMEIGAEILLRISREFVKSVEWLLTGRVRTMIPPTYNPKTRFMQLAIAEAKRPRDRGDNAHRLACCPIYLNVLASPLTRKPGFDGRKGAEQIPYLPEHIPGRGIAVRWRKAFSSAAKHPDSRSLIESSAADSSGSCRTFSSVR
jgi:hypothetical protein